MGDMPITEENGRVVLNCLELCAPSSTHEKKKNKTKQNKKQNKKQKQTKKKASLHEYTNY